MTSDKLASLSVEDLYLLADRMGLDLPEGLERVFVVEEILEALAEESEERAAARGDALRIEEMKFSGSGSDEPYVVREDQPALEPRYNETMIRAIVRDPSWAFAFWDISDAERAALRSDDGQTALFLRVTELGDAEDKRGEFFDIPVSHDDLQWYINLPRSGASFRIDLCARRPGARFRTLARSNPVTAPRQAISPGPFGLDARALDLLRLSGLEEFHIEGSDNPQRILSEPLNGSLSEPQGGSLGEPQSGPFVEAPRAAAQPSRANGC